MIGHPITLCCALAATLLLATAVGAEPTGEAASDALRREKNRLALRVAELEAAIERCTATTAKQRQALRDAAASRRRASLVPAASTLASGAAAAARSLRPAPPPARTAPRGSSSARIAPPDVVVVGDQIFVRGAVVNRGADAIRGWLKVEVLRDGRPIEGLVEHLDVPPRGRVPFDHRFLVTGFGSGTFTARARFKD